MSPFINLASLPPSSPSLREIIAPRPDSQQCRTSAHQASNHGREPSARDLITRHSQTATRITLTSPPCAARTPSRSSWDLDHDSRFSPLCLGSRPRRLSPRQPPTPKFVALPHNATRPVKPAAPLAFHLRASCTSCTTSRWVALAPSSVTSSEPPVGPARRLEPKEQGQRGEPV